MTVRSSTFVRRLEQSLQQSGLLDGHAHLLLAVSGGADSVALLTAMHALHKRFGLTLTVAHLDHRLRSTEGAADAAFVDMLSKRLDLPCLIGRSDVRRLARRKTLSLEMAAREARYRFLDRIARRHGATAIVTGHTADDQAETVLLRLVRGAGPAGLGGMQASVTVADLGVGLPRSSTRLLRPLLTVSRQDIEAFLNRYGMEWRNDASNACRDFLRNRVRHELIPLVEKRFNPSIKAGLCRTAEILGDEEAWLSTLVATTLEAAIGPEQELDCEALRAIVPALARRVIRAWLIAVEVSSQEVSYDLVERIRALAASSRGSRRVMLQNGRHVVRRYGKICAERAISTPAPFRVRLNVPGETLIRHSTLRVVVERGIGILREDHGQPGRLPAAASLSSRVVGRRGLYLRTLQAGDRMQPYGMQGSRKLQDILVDARVPADQRAIIPVLECGGQIAWLPGFRIAHPFRVTDSDSPALHVKIIGSL